MPAMPNPSQDQAPKKSSPIDARTMELGVDVPNEEHKLSERTQIRPDYEFNKHEMDGAVSADQSDDNKGDSALKALEAAGILLAANSIEKIRGLLPPNVHAIKDGSGTSYVFVTPQQGIEAGFPATVALGKDAGDGAGMGSISEKAWEQAGAMQAAVNQHKQVLDDKVPEKDVGAAKPQAEKAVEDFDPVLLLANEAFQNPALEGLDVRGEIPEAKKYAEPIHYDTDLDDSKKGLIGSDSDLEVKTDFAKAESNEKPENSPVPGIAASASSNIVQPSAEDRKKRHKFNGVSAADNVPEAETPPEPAPQ